MFLCIYYEHIVKNYIDYKIECCSQGGVLLMNVFKRCLKEQFGKSKYMSYVQMCEEEVLKNTYSKTKIEDKKIFKDMYEQLKEKNSEYIKERKDSLAETLYMALQIGRKFFSVFIFYLAANVAILALNLDYAVTCASVALMGVCFLYKLVEFLSNKYCFIDAYLIMVYKTVLEKLSGKTANSQG